MADPNARLTRLRFWLARRIDPYPDPGEAWCVHCTLNGGRTLVLPADGHMVHARAHADVHPGKHIIIRSTWPELAWKP